MAFTAGTTPSQEPLTLSQEMAHAVACYHEPRIHDFDLYWLLGTLNVFTLLPAIVIGLLINFAALMFLNRPPKITSGVYVYLKALLILDHLQLLTTLATVMTPQVCDFNYDNTHLLYNLCMYERRFLSLLMQRIHATVCTLHVWTIAALSAHRYWKISRPVLSRLNDTMRRATIMLTIMFSVIIAFRSPTFFVELSVSTKPMLKITKQHWATEVLTLYRFVYHTLLDPFVSNIIPFAWMSVFSLLTLYEFFHSRKFSYKQMSFESRRPASSVSSRQPLTSCFKKKAENLRQKQELRATISIVGIILMYLALHSLQILTIARKWQLLLQRQCPTRKDYIMTEIAILLSVISASVNAVIFIAFTKRLRKYVKMLLRKTSRTLSNSSEPPLSPRSTTTVDVAHHTFEHMDF